MDPRKTKFVYAAVSVAVVAAAAWSGSATTGDAAPGAAVSGRNVEQRGGDVVTDSGITSAADSVTAATRWLTDSNIVALVRAMNAPAVAAARIELQNWGNDTTMNFALSIFRDHAALTQTLDSLMAERQLTPSVPAIAATLLPPYQTQLTALYGYGARDLDRRFVAEQVKVHERVIAEVGPLAGLARDAALKGLLLGRVSMMERAHLTSARQLATKYAAADSAKRAAREARELRRRGR